MAVFAWSRSLPLTLAMGLLAGFGLILYVASTNTMLQLTTDDRYRGRVMSLYTLILHRDRADRGAALGLDRPASRRPGRHQPQRGGAARRRRSGSPTGCACSRRARSTPRRRRCSPRSSADQGFRPRRVRAENLERRDSISPGLRFTTLEGDDRCVIAPHGCCWRSRSRRLLEPDPLAGRDDRALRARARQRDRAIRSPGRPDGRPSDGRSDRAAHRAAAWGLPDPLKRPDGQALLLQRGLGDAARRVRPGVLPLARGDHPARGDVRALRVSSAYPSSGFGRRRLDVNSGSCPRRRSLRA